MPDPLEEPALILEESRPLFSWRRGVGTVMGRSKKEAEQQAAREAYSRIADRAARAGS